MPGDRSPGRRRPKIAASLCRIDGKAQSPALLAPGSMSAMVKSGLWSQNDSNSTLLSGHPSA
jgi:hypothetical protein